MQTPEPTAAIIREEPCGDGQPHEAHVFSYGPMNYQCPGEPPPDVTAASRIEELALALGQACRDLQQAHDELMVAQGCSRDSARNHDWPKWTPQANTIRWAEKLLGAELGKRGAQP